MINTINNAYIKNIDKYKYIILSSDKKIRKQNIYIYKQLNYIGITSFRLKINCFVFQLIN